MPQLDKIVFMSQLFWFTLSFLSLYLIILRYVLPTVATTLKMRKKQILLNKHNVHNSALETETINLAYETIFQKALNKSRTSLLDTVVLSTVWSKDSLKSLNETLFTDANKQFLKGSADIIGKNYLIKKLIKSN